MTLPRPQGFVVLCLATATILASAPISAGAVSAPDGPRAATPSGQDVGSPVAPRVSEVNTSAQAVVKTIPVGSGPEGIAIDEGDDTIYVANYLADTVSIINGRTGTVASTIRVGSYPINVAVNQRDDTVYVVNNGSGNVSVINGRTGVRTDDTIAVGSGPRGIGIDQSDDSVYVSHSTSVSVIKGRSASVAGTIAVGLNPSSVAVKSVDDTVYVANNTSGTLSVINGRTSTVVTTTSLSNTPLSLAVDQTDDTVYATNFTRDTVSIIDGRGGTLVSTVGVGAWPYGVAIDQTDDTVYVTTTPGISVINGRTGVLTDDTITLSGRAYGVAVDDSGLVYAPNYSGASLEVIARVAPSRSPSSGISGGGTPVTISLDIPQLPYDADDATVQSVTFGGTAGTGLAAGPGDTWTVTAPAGSGTVPVVVTLKGGHTARAGSFTYVGAPVITGVTPSSGPALGGTSLTISGAALGGATSVTIGGTPATSVTLVDDSTITATTPAHAAGAADVAVTTGGGTTTSAGAFTFVAAPVITGISPDNGPASGGTAITLTGAFLTGATSVTFGGTPATSVTVVDDTTITATTPAHTAGAVAVALTTSGGTTTSAAAFTFHSPPAPPATSSPPEAPTGVVAVADRVKASVSWESPPAAGSFPITHYQVISSPESRSCLTATPLTSCTVTGLSPGTSYTFTVRALNGAGWGAWSRPSNATTPSEPLAPSILVTGARDALQPSLIRVAGRSVGLSGRTVTPYHRLAGQSSFRAGLTTTVIAADGSFSWERRWGKRIHLYFTATACDTCVVVRSNTISIAAR